MTIPMEATMMAMATLDFSRPHVLRSVKEYAAAVAEVDRLLDRDPKKGTTEYDRLLFLAVLIEAYEDEHAPALPDVTPQQAVDFMLEQRGMARADLAPLLGGRSRVSEFFRGVRALSINQVKALRDTLGLPADLLIAR